MADSNRDVDQLIALTQKLWGSDEQALELEVDPIIENSLNNLALVGRIWAERALNRNAVKNTVQCSWNSRHGLRISDLDNNVFLFHFAAVEDVKRI